MPHGLPCLTMQTVGVLKFWKFGFGEPVKYEAPGGTFAYEVAKIEPYDGTL